MSDCRRCSECPDSSHHWLDNSDFGDDPSEAEGDTTHTHVCKHCPAYGDECDECGGDGRGEGEHDNCETCNGEGVIATPAD